MIGMIEAIYVLPFMLGIAVGSFCGSVIVMNAWMFDVSGATDPAESQGGPGPHLIVLPDGTIRHEGYGMEVTVWRL